MSIKFQYSNKLEQRVIFSHIYILITEISQCNLMSNIG